MLDPNHIDDRIRSGPDGPEPGAMFRDAGRALHSRVTFEGI
jgi:hypothetical protein